MRRLVEECYSSDNSCKLEEKVHKQDIKLIVLHMFNGIVISYKTEWITATNNTNTPQSLCLEKLPDIEWYILFDSKLVNFWNRETNPGEGKQNSVTAVGGSVWLGHKWSWWSEGRGSDLLMGVWFLQGCNLQMYPHSILTTIYFTA
jgi:hypothetical protein